MATADLLTMAPKTGDRQKALDSALAQIERQFGKGSIMTLGEGAVIPGVEATSTGSIGLDIASFAKLANSERSPFSNLIWAKSEFPFNLSIK